MREYHPTDTRYRGPTGSAAPKPLRSYLAERADTTSAISDPRADRKAAQVRQEQAYRDTQRSAPVWLRLIPFGAQWIDLKSEHARNTANSRGLRYTVFQVIGALLLYVILTNMIDPKVIAL